MMDGRYFSRDLEIAGTRLAFLSQPTPLNRLGNEIVLTVFISIYPLGGSVYTILDNHFYTSTVFPTFNSTLLAIAANRIEFRLSLKCA